LKTKDIRVTRAPHSVHIARILAVAQTLRENPPNRLRGPARDDVIAIAESAAAGIHDPSTMSFSPTRIDIAAQQRPRESIDYFPSRALAVNARVSSRRVGLFSRRGRAR
jgi:hypothetical protein